MVCGLWRDIESDWVNKQTSRSLKIEKLFQCLRTSIENKQKLLNKHFMIVNATNS